MTERQPRAAGKRVTFDHAEQILTRLPDGGFELRAEGQAATRVLPSPEGWQVEGTGGVEGWSLRRGGSTEGGFVLGSRSGDDEIGRTMPPVGIGSESGLFYLLLDDGRLFRIMMRGPRDGRFVLSGWESPGSYLEARPDGKGWVVLPTPAGTGIEDLRALSILFAAEILDTEEPLRSGAE